MLIRDLRIPPPMYISKRMYDSQGNPFNVPVCDLYVYLNSWLLVRCKYIIYYGIKRFFGFQSRFTFSTGLRTKDETVKTT